MPGTTTHFKLGLFALVAIAGIVVAALALGMHAMRSPKISYHTYFDESVQGLEIGSPVKYRGVRIGAVADIAIAPDRRLVGVELALRQRDVDRLDLAQPSLRTELVNEGLTGVKFIDLDFVDPASSPPPTLTFDPGSSYIPARPSMIKGLATGVGAIGSRLPPLVDRATAALDSVQRLLDDAHDQHVASRIGELADRASATLADIQQLVHGIDAARLPDHAATVLRDVDSAAAKLDRVLEQIDGDRGLVASARRATDSIGDVGRSARGQAEELSRALRELGDAARAFRQLVEAVERDPDMLVKGRARSGKR